MDIYISPSPAPVSISTTSNASTIDMPRCAVARLRNVLLFIFISVVHPHSGAHGNTRTQLRLVIGILGQHIEHDLQRHARAPGHRASRFDVGHGSLPKSEVPSAQVG